jgi:hypothetical protein
MTNGHAQRGWTYKATCQYMRSMSIDEKDAYNPALRFQSFGAYDLAAYENDLEEYPEYFDTHGWPLFGNVDPYALLHPFTGRPWYEAPREPRDDEAWEDYYDWYGIAIDFDNALTALSLHLRDTPEIVEPPVPSDTDAAYRPGGGVAFRGNIAYLRKHILPQLTSLLATRTSSPRLAALWGDIRDIITGLSVSLERLKQREKGILGARQSKGKDAQLLFYSEFCRFHRNKQKLTIQQTNKLFVSLAVDVARGKVLPPKGFDVEWFRKCIRPRKDHPKKYERAAILERCQTNPRLAELRSLPRNKRPHIPPIKPDLYKKV